MNNNKTELQVSALCNGTVIDHIPADKLFEVVDLLDIPSMKSNVTIGNNLESKKLGKKGLIKVVKESVGLKVLGNGTLSKALTVKAARFSAQAKEAIEKVGGTCEVID